MTVSSRHCLIKTGVASIVALSLAVNPIAPVATAAPDNNAGATTNNTADNKTTADKHDVVYRNTPDSPGIIKLGDAVEGTGKKAPQYEDAESLELVAAPEVKTYELVNTGAAQGATVDTDGVVTYTPENENGLDFGADNIALVSFDVLITYADDSTDTASVDFNVERKDPDPASKPHNERYTLVYNDSAIVKAPQGTSTSVDPKVDDRTVDGFSPEAPPSGTTYMVSTDPNQNTVPSGVKLDGQTGTVTYTPPATAAEGDTAQLYVVAKFPDGTVSDATMVVFEVAPAENSGAVEDETVTVTYPRKHQQNVGQRRQYKPEITYTGTTKPQPVSYAFVETPPDWVTIDEKTGVVTAYLEHSDAIVPPSLRRAPVRVMLDNGNYSTTEVSVTLFREGTWFRREQDSNVNIAYGDKPLMVGEEAKLSPIVWYDDDLIQPNPVSWEFFKYHPPGAEIDPKTGVVTVTPKKAGSLWYQIQANLDTGHWALGTLMVPVHEPVEVSFEEATVSGTNDSSQAVVGKQITLTPGARFNGSDTIPAGTVFALGADAPKGAVINPDTGVVTYTATETGPVSFPIVVTVGDDTFSHTYSVDVVEEQKDPEPPSTPLEVTFGSPDFTGLNEQSQVVINQRFTFTPKVTINGSTTLPKGTIFTLGNGAPAGALIDGVTGEVTYTSTKPGTLNFPVVVTLDGQTATHTYSVNVVDGPKPKKQPGDDDAQSSGVFVDIVPVVIGLAILGVLAGSFAKLPGFPPLELPVLLPPPPGR